MGATPVLLELSAFWNLSVTIGGETGLTTIVSSMFSRLEHGTGSGMETGLETGIGTGLGDILERLGEGAEQG